MLRKINQNIGRYKIPILFAVVIATLLTLVSFQLSWLRSSSELIEEQFDQKVNLAMGSALFDFNWKYDRNLDIDDMQDCGDSEDFMVIPLDQDKLTAEEQASLKESLRNYMTCYGIDEKYKAEVYYTVCPIDEKGYCCSLKTSNKCAQTFSLGVSFLSKKDYLFDKLKFMVGSSILVFLLLSTVSFIILRALINQKRLTENNIDFFNNTAHELKTPLTNISLALNLLTKKTSGLSENKYAHIIKSESVKLKDQIDRVLFLSRMENGDHRIKKEKLDMESLIRQVVEAMQMRIEEANARIRIHPPSKNVYAFGDPYHMRNVCQNLIDNSLKYCDKTPEIDISLRVDDQQVFLCFKDNGIGISAKDQVHIFEKFQRVNTGDIREAKGFGIGLAYVKKVMDLHKGLIRVTSELKKGSLFELGLPRA